jgi:hypothetical protein
MLAQVCCAFRSLGHASNQDIIALAAVVVLKQRKS